jgi:hypothetical protein
MSDKRSCRTGRTWRLRSQPLHGNVVETLPNTVLTNVLSTYLSLHDVGNMLRLNRRMKASIADAASKRLEASDRELLYSDSILNPIAVATSSIHVFVHSGDRVLIFGRTTTRLVRVVTIPCDAPFPRSLSTKLVVHETSQRFALMYRDGHILIYNVDGSLFRKRKLCEEAEAYNDYLRNDIVHHAMCKYKHRLEYLAIAFTDKIVVLLTYTHLRHPQSSFQLKALDLSTGDLLYAVELDKTFGDRRATPNKFELLISPDEPDIVYVLHHKTSLSYFSSSGSGSRLHNWSVVVAYSLTGALRRRVVYVTQHLLQSLSFVGDTLVSNEQVDDGVRYRELDESVSHMSSEYLPNVDEKWNVVSFSPHANITWLETSRNNFNENGEQQTPWSIPNVLCSFSSSLMAASNFEGELHMFQIANGQTTTHDERATLREGCGIKTRWVTDWVPAVFKQVRALTISGGVVKSYGRTNM